MHGLEVFGLGWLTHLFHGITHSIGSLSPVAGAAIEWIVNALFAGLFGLALGYLIVLVHHRFAGVQKV